jgi:hypothetical protein
MKRGKTCQLDEYEKVCDEERRSENERFRSKIGVYQQTVSEVSEGIRRRGKKRTPAFIETHMILQDEKGVAAVLEQTGRNVKGGGLEVSVASVLGLSVTEEIAVEVGGEGERSAA